jgi:hypothetical protein
LPRSHKAGRARAVRRAADAVLFPQRYLARNEKLDQIYQAAVDNRRLRASLEDLVTSWDGMNRLVHERNETELRAAQRDGHCHEAVMWYVHHLTQARRRSSERRGARWVCVCVRSCVRARVRVHMYRLPRARLSAA